jgi:hypothetical protein
MRFQKSVSGNPAGRPRGSRNKSNILLQKISNEDAQAIMDTATALAKQGNVAAMRLCVQLFRPLRRAEPVTCDLPILKTPADVLAAMQIIVADVAAGELTPAEGADLAKLADLFLQTLASLNFEQRLRAVEKGAAVERALAPPPPQSELNQSEDCKREPTAASSVEPKRCSDNPSGPFWFA